MVISEFISDKFKIDLIYIKLLSYFRFYQSFILTHLDGIKSKKSVIETLKHHNNIRMIGIKVIINIIFIEI